MKGSYLHAPPVVHASDGAPGNVVDRRLVDAAERSVLAISPCAGKGRARKAGIVDIAIALIEIAHGD